MAEQLLETQEVVGGLPGGASGLIPPTPGTELDLSARPTEQYVAGQKLQWYINLPHALPWSFDDIGVEFGSDIYERMLVDAQVRSVVNVMKAGILEDGVEIRPALDHEEDDGYEQAAQLAEQVEAMFENLATPLDDVLWDMLDAVALGNRAAELVFRLDGGYMLDRIAVRPRESTAFVVDAYLTVVGILGRIPGQPFGVQQGMLLADIQHTANLLPRSKFAVLTYRPKNGDPRGTSVLRAAFDPWNQKQQLKREYLKYLTQFAAPSLIGYTAEHAEPYAVLGADGQPQLADGQPVMQTPEQDMVAALQQFHNGTATAFPFGSKVQPIEMNAQGGDPFLQAFNHCDRQITKAVLQQTLATEEAEHQARSASEVHKDVLDTLTRQGKRPIERMIERDILKVWLLLNHDAKMLPLLPKVSLGETEQEDFAALWTAAATLARAGYLHSSQYAGIDAQLGLPKREPAEASTPSEYVTVNAKTGTPDIQLPKASGEQAANAPTPPAGATAGFAADAALADLGQWQQEAAEAVRQGKTPRMFLADHVDPVTQFAVAESLAHAKSEADVARIFDLAQAAVDSDEPFGLV